MNGTGESNSGVDPAGGGRQFLTFTLGGEDYGVEILRVQEIRGFTAVTPVPNSPAYVRGVMNLRGTVVPVFDLRLKFGMPSKEYDRFTVIVVVNVGARVVGLVVDAVSDVLDIAHASIDTSPDLGGEVDTAILQGIARSGDRLVTLLDIDRVVGPETAHVPAPQAAAA